MSDEVDTFAKVEREDYKVAPKFKVSKIKNQIRRVEAQKKIQRQEDATLNLILLGVLKPDGGWRF